MFLPSTKLSFYFLPAICIMEAQFKSYFPVLIRPFYSAIAFEHECTCIWLESLLDIYTFMCGAPLLALLPLEAILQLSSEAGVPLLLQQYVTSEALRGRRWGCKQQSPSTPRSVYPWKWNFRKFSDELDLGLPPMGFPYPLVSYLFLKNMWQVESLDTATETSSSIP